ncbi:hypothetical protein D3C84_938540 [compost metagenome]
MFGCGIEQQRCGGDHAAEAHVGDVTHAVQRNKAQTVCASGPRAFGLPHHDAAGDAAGIEA